MLEIPVETGEQYVLGYKMFPAAGLVGLLISWFLIQTNTLKKIEKEIGEE